MWKELFRYKNYFCIKIELLKQSNDDNSGAIRPAIPGLADENIMEASVLMNSVVKLVQV